MYGEKDRLVEDSRALTKIFEKAKLVCFCIAADVCVMKARCSTTVMIGKLNERVLAKMNTAKAIIW